jgi:hypothetical protein
MMWNTYERTELYGEGFQSYAISIYAPENTYVDMARTYIVEA